MEIIEKGKKWIAKKRCRGTGDGCGALLLVEEDDIFADISGIENDQFKCAYCFCCPECDCITEMSEKSLPAKVRKIALEKYNVELAKRKKEKNIGGLL